MNTQTLTEPTTSKVNATLIISRTFNAPRELVYEVWTKPEHLAKWWGPAGAELKVTKLELRPGGMFLYCMTMPHGNAMWGRFVYQNFNRPQGMEFTSAISDESGGIQPNP